MSAVSPQDFRRRPPFLLGPLEQPFRSEGRMHGMRPTRSNGCQRNQRSGRDQDMHVLYLSHVLPPRTMWPRSGWLDSNQQPPGTSLALSRTGSVGTPSLPVVELHPGTVPGRNHTAVCLKSKIRSFERSCFVKSTEHVGRERAHEAGDNLLSPNGVPSAQEGLTAVFGMRTGVAPPINHQLHGRVHDLTS